MAKRFGMSRGHSRSTFARGAQRIHQKNSLRAMPMRGGIRL